MKDSESNPDLVLDYRIYDFYDEEEKLYSPVGVEFSALGLSKWMVARHWIQLKEKYGDKVRVIQTDTDSLHFKLYGHNLYADIKKI